MADWNRRERTVVIVEYYLNDGTPVQEIYKALDAAAHECAALKGKTVDQLSGDFVTIHAGDDEIIIRYTQEITPD